MGAFWKGGGSLGAVRIYGIYEYTIQVPLKDCIGVILKTPMLVAVIAKKSQQQPPRQQQHKQRH